jgi:hypothetical protein
MTLRVGVPVRSASLNTSQLESLHRLWLTAGLPPLSGYSTVFLAVAVATDHPVADTVTSVDFKQPGSVDDAVEVLVAWYRRCQGVDVAVGVG